jgi:hypothetical protein
MGKMDKEAMAAANLLDVQKLTLVAAFNQVSIAMRECAAQAEQFAQSITNLPAGGNVNPQTLQLMAAAMSSMPRGNAFPAMAQAMLQQMPSAQSPEASPGETTTKGKRTRGKKAKRDPNKPKRPASAYLMYQNVVRKDFAAKYPGLPYHEVLAKISDEWQKLPDEDKEPYREATRLAKIKYDGLKASYDAGLAANGQNPASSSPPGSASPTIKTTKHPIVAADSSCDEDESSEDDDEEEEEEQPAPKKQKTAPAPVPIATPSASEKKSKEKDKDKERDRSKDREKDKDREEKKPKEEKKKSKKAQT